MGQLFDAALNSYFGSSEGAFSVVTNNEYKKSQVTFTGPEQKLVEAFFGNKLAGRNGNIDEIRSRGIKPNLDFRLFPSGRIVSLTVSYKTNRPTELRYYMRADAFKPLEGEHWCVFIRDNEIWLGSFSNFTLDLVASNGPSDVDRGAILEPETDSYQDVLNSKEPTQTISAQLSWSRNPKVARTALIKANYKCELRPDFPSFLQKGTDRTFLEAHHLIPMRLQNLFKSRSLDVVDNICALNPLAHRMLHHADFGAIEVHLSKLIATRKPLLQSLGINEYDVLGMYNK